MTSKTKKDTTLYEAARNIKDAGEKALFVFDLDGTLIDIRSHRIPQCTIDALNQLRGQGHQLMICTSRPIETIRTIPHIDEIPWDAIVACGGSRVYDSEGNLRFDKAPSKDTIRKIVKIADENQIPFYFAGEKEFFTLANDDMIDFIHFYGLDEERLIRTVQPWNDFDTPLITVLDRDEERIRKLFGSIPGLRLNRAWTWNSDIYPDGIDKMTGIREAAKLLSRPVSPLFAFGDTSADNVMLEEADLGLAMPQAMEQTKEAADFTLEDFGPSTFYQFFKRSGFLSD